MNRLIIEVCVLYEKMANGILRAANRAAEAAYMRDVRKSYKANRRMQ